jgi:hypothetical protein
MSDRSLAWPGTPQWITGRNRRITAGSKRKIHGSAGRAGEALDLDRDRQPRRGHA